jgi:heat shock protein HslJ
MLRTIVSYVVVLIVISGCSSADLLSQLYGKEWNVTSILGKTLTNGSNIEKLPSINFGDNGKLFGSTGCNNFIGSYKLSGTLLTLEPGALTKMFCPDSPEQEFLNAIRQVTNVKVDGSTLNLLNGANTVMTLVPKSN